MKDNFLANLVHRIRAPRPISQHKNSTSPRAFQFQLIVLPLILAAVGFAIAALILFGAVEDEVLRIQRLDNSVIETQVEKDFQSLTSTSARQVDHILAQPANQVQSLAAYMAANYENLASISLEKYWPVENHLIKLAGGQWGNATGDITSVFVPNYVDIESTVQNDLILSACMDLVAPGILANNPEVEAIHFTSTRNILRYYPNINLAEILPPDFKATDQLWYSEGLESNLQAGPSFTPPYMDAAGKMMVTTVNAPVLDKAGNLLGMVGIDVSLNSIAQEVGRFENPYAGYIFLINETGTAIVLPALGYQDFLNRQPGSDEVAPDLSSSKGNFSAIINEMRAGKAGLSRVQVNDRQLIIAYTPLKVVGWSLGNVVEQSAISAAVPFSIADPGQSSRVLLIGKVFPVMVLVFALIVVVGVLLTNRLFDPVNKLSAAVQQIAARQWDVNIPVQAPGQIGTLARAFLSMKNDLYAVLSNLEERVVERTQALARRTVQLQTASEIASEITATRNFEVLMDRTVHLLVDRFGYNHAGIFLIDSQNEFAVLQAASGETGRAMLEQGHQLHLSSSTIVGSVASSGESKIAWDAGADAIYFRNTVIPNIHSELALPLVINQKVIGVLDVQSQEVNAFGQQDLDVLQILADQLSIAIDTARLFQQHQETLHQLETLQSRISSDVWVGLSKSVNFSGYQIDAAGLRPLYAKNKNGEIESPPYSLPIKIRGNTVAQLDIWPVGNQLNPGELKLLDLISDRLGQAIESARIFEETQKRAGREQAVNEFVTSLSGSFDLDSLIQTAVQHLGKLPDVAEVSIRIDPSLETDDQR